MGTDRRVTVLAVLAGILYNSWLLGWWLNPAVAKTGLASEFEALHQPYNWLFIVCDVLCSLLVLTVYLMLRRSRTARNLSWPLVGLAAFAIGTITDALLPMSCEPSLQRCPSFTQDHMLLAHGIFSIGAALALFASLFLFWWRDRRSRLLSILLAAYVLFGLFSLVDALRPVHQNWSQHYYLVLCGIWLACVPSVLGNITPAESKVRHHDGKD